MAAVFFNKVLAVYRLQRANSGPDERAIPHIAERANSGPDERAIPHIAEEIIPPISGNPRIIDVDQHINVKGGL